MRRILIIIAVIVLLLIIKNNTSTIFRTFEDENTAESLKKKLALEEKKNQFLKERFFYVKTDKFVEEEAREKLGMSRPGEYIVIAPTSTPLDQKRIEINDKPNWRRWLELFF